MTVRRGSDPSWSPDGQRLAFISNGRLFTIGSNGKGKRRLSHIGEVVVGQAWAPKGNLIADLVGTCRACVVPRSLRLETVNASSGRARVLMRARRSLIWGEPVWMPSARRILVVVEPH